jgi:opacity protein-like surface antigen
MEETSHRRLALVVLGVLSLVDSGPSWADERQEHALHTGYYLSLTPSAVFPFSLNTTSPLLSPARIRTEAGADISGALGYRSGDIRVEGAALYGRFDADSIRFLEGGGALSGYFDLRGTSVQVFYDLPTGTRLRPYVGAGLGVMRFRARAVTLSGFPPTVGSNTLLAHQLMGGISYAASHSWRLALGYRYMGMGEQDYETGGVPLRGGSIRTHAVQVSTQFFF